jgi:hypothetical protein
MQDKKVFGVIYKHTNIEKPDKCYIGQTTAKPNRRFRKSSTDYRGYKNCVAFHNALQHYTWNGFTTEILCECESQEELNRMEEFYIKKFNSIAPNGYNLNSIIEGSVKLSEETKKKIGEKQKAYSASLKERPVSATRKPHIFINNIEHKNCSKCKQDKPLSEFGSYKTRWDGLNPSCKKCHAEHKAKTYKYEGLSDKEFRESYAKRSEALSKGQKEYYKRNPQKRVALAKRQSKAVIATSISGQETLEFESAKAAGSFGFNNTNIGIAIKKGTPYKGYLWTFKKS